MCTWLLLRLTGLRLTGSGHGGESTVLMSATDRKGRKGPAFAVLRFRPPVDGRAAVDRAFLAFFSYLSAYPNNFAASLPSSTIRKQDHKQSRETAAYKRM